MMLQQKTGLHIRLVITLMVLLPGLVCRGQVLSPQLQPGKYLELTEEQYVQQHYALANQSARQYLEATNQTGLTVKTSDQEKARYYLTLSSLKINEPNCADEAATEMKATTNPAYSQRIAFSLAQYYFRRNDMAHAIPLYESAGINNLDNTEISDAKFELAYCYFNNRQFDKAEPLLQAIKEIKDGKYYKEGNYYYGLLAYNQNKYKEALKSFNRIKDQKEYRAIVPYYIAEIYYFMGARENALKLADTLIKRTDKSFYDKELHLLEAQCLFETQRYAEASPFFGFYYDHSDKIRKQDLYEMAYCDYKTSQWTSAIEKFKMLSDAHDSLGQTSMYLLGDCYLKTGDKKSARNAFGICADMRFNENQQEASMILYSKTSYETGNNDDALRELNILLKTFPHTQYKDEANTLISDLLLKTNQYEEAMKHLEVVSHKDDNYKLVFQKATFGYAVQKFREGDLVSAAKYFTYSTQNPVNIDYEDAAWFWRGEIAYHQRQFPEVITYSQDFINKKGNKAYIEHISPMATMQHAYLNMGYAAMETQNFSGAQTFFNQAQKEGGNDKFSGSIAALKEADAVFMQKNYTRAIVLYEKIANTDTVNADYARYQKSILLGLLGKPGEKIAVLNSLINKEPPSAYANYARYEIAVTFIETDRNNEALPYLHYLTDSASDKSFAPRSWMKTGFIYQQLNDNNMAIESYKHVIIDYPGSEDRLPAMDALKSLYIQSNQPAAYTQMLRDNHLPSADSSSVDSTYYAAAESQFAGGKYPDAKQAFTSYLEQYPRGIFAIKAHYYRAESEMQLKQYKDARADYDVALSGPWNEFVENSARRSAKIAYDDRDFLAAFGYYLRLRMVTTSTQLKELAWNGLMKSGFNSGKYPETRQYADSLLCLPGISAETIGDALYYKAKTLQQLDSSADAIKIYRQLAENHNDEISAESRYRIAEILFDNDKLKDAEDAANATIHLSAGYETWVGKSYILLADILVKEKDYFNAKALLQSIVKRTKITELKTEASKRLEEVKKLEKHQSKLSEE